MILSAADILRILGGSEIIRLSAKTKISDGQPTLSGAEGMCIYIARFPTVSEFQATWTLYIENDDSEPEDLVIAEIKRLLPSVKTADGLFTVVTTTDFLSESTQRAPEAPEVVQSGVVEGKLEERFQELSEDINDRMLLISSGRDGLAGADGRDGVDGRDGRDLLATDTELFDLKDAGPSVIGLKKGQVLTWDGAQWTNLYVATSSTVSGGGNGGGGGTGTALTIQSRSRGDLSAPPTNVVEDVAAISFDTDSGFVVEELEDGTKEAFVKLNSTFNPWHVDGQNTLDATGEEPVEFVAGAGIILRTDATSDPKQIIIESDGTGGGGGGQVNSDTIVSESSPTQRENGKGALRNGDGWFKVSSQQLYVYDEGSWYLASNGGGGGSGGPCDGILDGGNADNGTSDGVDCGPTFPEAPVDGKQYARQDAAWTEVAPSGIEEAPDDGNFYVRQDGAWVDLNVALFALNNREIDGGDFTTGSSNGSGDVVDGGSFT